MGRTSSTLVNNNNNLLFIHTLLNLNRNSKVRAVSSGCHSWKHTSVEYESFFETRVWKKLTCISWVSVTEIISSVCFCFFPEAGAIVINESKPLETKPLETCFDEEEKNVLPQCSEKTVNDLFDDLLKQASQDIEEQQDRKAALQVHQTVPDLPENTDLNLSASTTLQQEPFEEKYPDKSVSSPVQPEHFDETDLDSILINPSSLAEIECVDDFARPADVGYLQETNLDDFQPDDAPKYLGSEIVAQLPTGEYHTEPSPAREPEVIRNVVEGDVRDEIDVVENEQLDDAGNVIHKKVTTVQHIVPLMEIITEDGVETYRDTVDVLLGIEIDENIHVYPPGIPDSYLGQLEMDSVTDECEEVSPSGCPITRRTTTSIARVPHAVHDVGPLETEFPSSISENEEPLRELVCH